MAIEIFSKVATSIGEDLDKFAEGFLIFRNGMETDEDYRKRLLAWFFKMPIPEKL